MSTEEDDEVLLEGGHLHEHLKQTTSQQCAVFKSEQDNDPLFKDTLYLATPKKVAVEIKEFVDIILNSAMMLDEDAHYVYILSQKLEVQPQHLHLKTLASLGSLFLSGCAAIFVKKKESLLPLWLGTTYFTLMNLRQLVSYRLLNSRLHNLCKIMNLTYCRLKKHFNLLHQQVTCITTKEICLSQKMNKKMMNEKYVWARKQISLLSVELLNVLMNILNCSKSSTRALLEIIEEPASDEKYYACRTDGQLGLEPILEQCQNGQLNLSSLEVVRHLNIILQSEFLRLLGFYAFKMKTNYQREKLCRVLKNYGDCLTRLTVLSVDNSKQYQGLQPNKKCLSNNRSNLVEATQNLKLYLHSLVVEFADIEDTLSANNLSREEAQYIVRVALDTVTKELKEIYPIIKKIRKMLGQKKGSSKDVKMSVNNSDTVQVLKTGIEVGKSDFTLHSVDEIFLGISGSESGSACTEEPDEQTAELDSTVLATYDKVIAEFKVALKSQRKQFEERELVALMQNPNYQEYMEFLSNVKEQPMASTHRLKRDFEETKPPKSEETKISSIDSSNFDLHKTIALKAVSKSLQWKNPCSEETSFES
ncbi:uncharacterized protein isoform X2 [Rhodnius prolixus]|uniref:uncharacterized protein isoform X2 n=1 Tax=Rhodnius prolixus TaxID=13249 RepID=UPI003D18CA9B